MKLLTKIAILIGFIVTISSCQKESLPAPNSCSSHENGAANQRVSGSNDSGNAVNPLIKADENIRTDEIVGGGDDDRDGGDGKKGKKGN